MVHTPVVEVPMCLRRETHDAPVQLFRIVGGGLAAAYFVRLLREFGDFSAANGLIDHALVQRVYPETRVSLFQAGLPGVVIAIALVIAVLATIGILVGWRVRLCAAVALAVAASTYRWNFIVMYLDDAVIHLLLFWFMLLPVTRSSGLVVLLRSPRQALSRWSATTVPGTAVTCLELNIALIYIIAGLWKFNSPLWRSGYGLYAALRLPVATMPDVWGPEHLPWLRLANWMVMASEPFMALPLFLRAGHPLKRLGGVVFAGFHLFIFATLGLPYAMFGLLASAILFFGPELNATLARWSGATPVRPQVLPGLTRSGKLAVAFVIVLAMATTRRIPVIGALNVPAYGVLWMVGVAQDYRLFNWIDRVNFDVETQVIALGPNGETTPVTEVSTYPSSFRSSLLLAYLHDIRWLRLPRQHRREMRASIAVRLAGWYCVHNERDGPLRIESAIYRLVPEGRHYLSSLIVAEFECRQGKAAISRVLRSVPGKPD